MDVLQVGFGKDSLACLYLLKPKWDELTVMWLNTGASFPEVEEAAERVRAMVPHFMEVRSDVMTDIAKYGWPSDLVPTRSTGWGHVSRGTSGMVMRPWYECCRNNFWEPMDAAVRSIGAKRVYRGQRLSEDYKSPVRSGAVIDGIEYVFPIERWSEEQVFDFLRANDIVIPSYYGYTGTSLDCWNCTAYLDAKMGQLQYMRDHHPNKYRFVRQKLVEMGNAVSEDLGLLRQAIQ